MVNPKSTTEVFLLRIALVGKKQNLKCVFLKIMISDIRQFRKLAAIRSCLNQLIYFLDLCQIKVPKVPVITLPVNAPNKFKFVLFFNLCNNQKP